MKIYLINKETNEVLQKFDNVISWTDNSVTYLNGGYKAKMYCDEDEYFTDVEVNNG